MSDHSKIGDVLDKWAAAAHEAKLTPEEVVNAAAEWLAIIIMNTCPTEQMCHQVLNSADENSHLYINQNWREAALAQRLARSR